MNIEKVLEELDGLFGQHRVDEVEPFLLQKTEEASKEGDTASMITLLNEIIGHYRELGEYEKSIASCRELLILVEQAGLKGPMQRLCLTLQTPAGLPDFYGNP